MADTGKILLTGATGFLGYHVAVALTSGAQSSEAGGEAREVVALVRDPDSSSAARLRELPGLTLAQGDVLDAESIERAAQGCVAVLHCAGKVSRGSTDVVEMTRVNIRGVEVVLDACKAAGVTRAVVASTSGTIGVSDDPDQVANEDDSPPLSLINRWPYYRSKYYGEQAALDRNVEGFEVVIVNPALLLGPGDLHGSSTEDVRRVLEQRMPVVPAGGYAFVDARDAARGMIQALDAGKAGRRYLLVSCNCTIQTFVNRISRVADLGGAVFALPDRKAVKRVTKWFVRQAQDILGEDDALPDEASIELAQYYWYVDSTRAENELGWSARDPMLTLADTVADLRARGVVVLRPAR